MTTTDPIPMRLPCPGCGQLHIDEGEFATQPHHSHACQFCGLVWRPALVHTVGVRFLPGFKNEVLSTTTISPEIAHCGYVLTPGWVLASTSSEECMHQSPAGEFDCKSRPAYYKVDWGYCFDHAIENGALFSAFMYDAKQDGS